jgi:predicted transcriptional regulator
MRPLPEWMTRSDIAILRFLAGHEIGPFEVPPLAIARNTGTSESHTRARVRDLHRSGLIDRVEGVRGYYQITDLGERFVSNDLSDDERQQLDALDINGENADDDSGNNNTGDNDKR